MELFHLLACQQSARGHRGSDNQGCTVLDTHLGWLHIEDLCDPPLHNQEVRVVDIELNRAKEVLHSRGCGITTIDQVLITSTNHNLNRE